MNEFPISKDDDGIKLHKWLRKQFAELPLSGIHKALRTKRIKLNGKRAKGEEVLSEGDVVAVFLQFDPSASTKKPTSLAAPIPEAVKAKISILFEDADLLALDKPAGMSVHPGSGTALGRSVIEVVSALYPDETLRLAHRLDKDTSGILLVAKHGKALRGLLKSLRSGAFHKQYQALVFGRLTDSGGTIDLPLERHTHGQKITAGSGKRAVTHYRVLSRFAETTLVEIDLETGRTHQIRAHFAALGHPLCLDQLHGDFEKNKAFRKQFGLKRQFLHACRLRFPHPETGRQVEVISPLPSDLALVMERMR